MFLFSKYKVNNKNYNCFFIRHEFACFINCELKMNWVLIQIEVTIFQCVLLTAHSNIMRMVYINHPLHSMRCVFRKQLTLRRTVCIVYRANVWQYLYLVCSRGTITSWDGSRKSMAAFKCYMCLLTTFGDRTLCYITSELSKYHIIRSSEEIMHKHKRHKNTFVDSFCA